MSQSPQKSDSLSPRSADAEPNTAESKEVSAESATGMEVDENAEQRDTESKPQESPSESSSEPAQETAEPAEDEENNTEKKSEDAEMEGQEEEVEGDEEGEKSGNQEQVDPIFDQMLLKPLFERREKNLKELLDSMDEFSPIIPDAVTDYYLAKSGFRTSDHRIKRLLALATQKFVADIANDAYQFSKIRAQTANAAGGAGRGRAGPGSTSGRTVLTMESLSGVLGDYGINAKRPDFYR